MVDFTINYIGILFFIDTQVKDNCSYMKVNNINNTF